MTEGFLVAETCWPCVVGLHEECYEPMVVAETQESGAIIKCCCHSAKAPDDAHDFAGFGVGRPVADPKDITDVTSTGRRRAAQLYVIFEGMACEWAFLAAAGGGIHPIVGCRGNTISATKTGPHAGHRHHGPDKNVLDNAQGNVHRICTTCHVRWHTLNNETYVGERPPADQQWFPEGEWHPHDALTFATEEELDDWDAFWKKKPVDRVDMDD